MNTEHAIGARVSCWVLRTKLRVNTMFMEEGGGIVIVL